MEIIKALERFNRKERYWLIRNALGSAAVLDGNFRARLGSVVGMDIPEDAWWAMDYHIDWLVGALVLATGGTIDEAMTKHDSAVSGTQEDIDFIVAFGRVIVLVEAKGATSWSNSQTNSKLDRLTKIIDNPELRGDMELDIRYVLMSPREPQKLMRTNAEGWPRWMCRPGSDEPTWLALDMKSDDGFVRIAREGPGSESANEAPRPWRIATA